MALKIAIQSVETPDGLFSVVVADDAVVASGWGQDIDRILAQLPSSLGPLVDDGDDPPALSGVVAAVEAYYDGDFAALDAVPVRQFGTAFQLAVWQKLREVPAGATVTYGELARRAGYPLAARAVGSVMAQNAVPLIVPCHRVVRADGTIGQFGFGAELKRALLLREGATLSGGVRS